MLIPKIMPKLNADIDEKLVQKIDKKLDEKTNQLSEQLYEMTVQHEAARLKDNLKLAQEIDAIKQKSTANNVPEPDDFTFHRIGAVKPVVAGFHIMMNNDSIKSKIIECKDYICLTLEYK